MGLFAPTPTHVPAHPPCAHAAPIPPPQLLIPLNALNALHTQHCHAQYLGEFDAQGRLKDAAPAARRSTAYNAFVKENLSTVKGQLPRGTPMQAVMQELGAVWRARAAAAAVPADTPAAAGEP